MTDENIINANNDLSVVWLDTTIQNNRKSQETRERINRVAKHQLKTFDDQDNCIDLITSELSEKNIHLIVSNALGGIVVPLIHDFPQIKNIYVYCRDRKVAEEWSKKYSKVNGIFTEQRPLVHKLCCDIYGCDPDGEFQMSIFHLADRERSLRELTEESAAFMWYQAIIMSLRCLAKYYNAKTEMIAACRAAYRNDSAELRKIQNFEDNYYPTRVFWWYTSDSFVYRLLNKALRTQDIEIIFKFRFFINELHNQIGESYRHYLHNASTHIGTDLIVYRGQRLSMEEVKLLENNVNELISTNSFLSTTRSQELATIFADTSDQVNNPTPLQSVLFIIHITKMSEETTAFAFIDKGCGPNDEQEVLFSISAIFKVQSVEKIENMWHVDLQLSKEENDINNSLLHHMIKEIGSDANPLSFGWFLYRTNKFVEAESYANMMLKQLPPNDQAIGDAYNLLGLIYKDKHNLQKAVESYEEALRIYERLNLHNTAQVIATHCSLGVAYLEIGDIRNAKEQGAKAEGKLINSSSAQNSLLQATLESLKAKIAAENGEHEVALEKFNDVLKRKRARLPPDHPAVASTRNEMGNVQKRMGEYKKALENFEEALRIAKRTLPANHVDIADYHTNIGCILDKLGEYERALKNFELALKIVEEDPRELCERVDMLEAYIDEMKKKLNRKGKCS